MCLAAKPSFLLYSIHECNFSLICLAVHLLDTMAASDSKFFWRCNKLSLSCVNYRLRLLWHSFGQHKTQFDKACWVWNSSSGRHFSVLLFLTLLTAMQTAEYCTSIFFGAKSESLAFYFGTQNMHFLMHDDINMSRMPLIFLDCFHIVTLLQSNCVKCCTCMCCLHSK